MIDNTSLKKILTYIDLTSLESTDNEKTILDLVRKANQGYNGLHIAAVCVFPNFGDLVRKSLISSINVAVVGGCFPSGQTLSEAKSAELDTINQTATDEVDIVINRGEFLAGNFDFVHREIELMRQAIPNKILKVILETGELKTAENISKASQIAISAGADFIKTSTGKSATGATLDAVQVMCETIVTYHKKTGKKIGIKPSGGIREINEAVKYINVVQTILGTDWLTNKLFRIGASSLYDAILKELTVDNE